MKSINLIDCFPEPANGQKRGPLPKQLQFIQSALNVADGPKYIRYVGGIGSGKSLIGCITMLAWAVSYPGDYLVARQFMPELRDSTYKTFLEVCPPELIVEHRVADAIVKVRSNGGIANIMFRALEEPDKLRSLNLNGFYIDEANQVSEEAFILLQGRLRGKHVRKGIITQNSGGHDWSWRWFVRQDMFNNAQAKAMFFNIKAPSTENVHLHESYVRSMLDTWSEERVKREIMADEDSFEGQVYSEFRRDVHVVHPFAVPDGWTRVIGADHGFRNPAAWIWGAVDPDDNIYIYREFYEKEWIVEEIVKGNKKLAKPGILSLTGKEKIDGCYIDPSIRATRSSKNGKPWSEWDEFIEHLPEQFPLLPASNDVHAGIDRVKRFLKVNETTKKPKLFIFSTCANLIDELMNYKYQPLRSTQEGRRNEREDPIKFNDHAVDAMRYLIMSRPEPTINPESIWDKIKYDSLQGSLIREIQATREPKNSGKDPFDS